MDLAEIQINTLSLALLVMLLAAIAVAGLVMLRERRTRQNLSGLSDRLALTEATLSAAPSGYIWLQHGTALEENPVPSGASGIVGLNTNTPSRFANVIAAIDPETRDAFQSNCVELVLSNTPFSMDVKTKNGNREIRVQGRMLRGKSGAVLWLTDRREDHQALQLMMDLKDRFERELHQINRVLDLLPVPLWLREGSETTKALNGFGTSLNPDDDTLKILAERARRSKLPQSESRHRILNGKRRLFEFNEVPLGPEAEQTLGYALEVTALEESQSELSRHVAAHGEVLETLATAMAIFGADKRLKFANSAFARLWRIESDVIAGDPTVTEFLELLRERRRLPEQSDFRMFRDQWNGMFNSLIEAHEELLFLPDDSTIRMVVTPHPFGGLMMIFEDVTDTLALERSYNTLIDVQKETIDNLYEGIAVIGGDGRLKLSNRAFARVWNVTDEMAWSEPHARDLMSHFTGQLAALPDQDEPEENLFEDLFARQLRSGQIRLKSGMVLDYSAVPLPDGATLTSFLDVTDRANVQWALQERNEALEAADLLKTEFIASVSYELRTPLNAIIGLSEMLEMEMFGDLNEQQKEYAHGIRESSTRLVDLVNEILDLATIEAGYLDLEESMINVADLVSAVEGLGKEPARNRGVSMEYKCDPDLPNLYGDERRLKQAMFNVVLSGLKKARQNGKISVHATKDNGAVCIIFEDTSVYLPTEEEIGRPVWRRAQAGQNLGIGLGLSLVTRLLELHGGSLEVEVSIEKTQRIICRLPVRQAPETV